MPELAEVETVRTVLEKKILNKKIVNVRIIYGNMIENDLEEFKGKLINNSFRSIDRLGKWLIFNLDNYTLLSHLRMEGKYFIKPSFEKIDTHEHVIFDFEDNTSLRYHDVRKFGVMKLVNSEDTYKTKELSKQGLEIINPNLSKEYLYNKIHTKRISIKTLLLNQEIISGIGNIYADEILFASNINPLRIGNTITLDECDKIIKNGSRILLHSIKEGGCTIRSYTSSLGVKGNYQNFLCVHTKEFKPCKNCNNPIKRIEIGGRSTYYCDTCQK